MLLPDLSGTVVEHHWEEAVVERQASGDWDLFDEEVFGLCQCASVLHGWAGCEELVDDGDEFWAFGRAVCEACSRRTADHVWLH